jgi:NSS family neurotransmitter:Na+ symporter
VLVPLLLVWLAVAAHHGPGRAARDRLTSLVLIPVLVLAFAALVVQA